MTRKRGGPGVLGRIHQGFGIRRMIRGLLESTRFPAKDPSSARTGAHMASLEAAILSISRGNLSIEDGFEVCIGYV